MSRHAIGVAAVVTCGVLAHASALPAADLTGKVQSRDGARLPFSVVVARSTASEAEWRVVASELGTFRLSGLPPGTYDVRVDAPGFRPVTVQGIALADADAVASIEPVLDIDAVVESVVVRGAAPREGLESASLREMGARDVGGALTAASGLWQQRKGAIANEVVVRGLQSRDLNVLVDGQRVDGACPNHMDPPAFHVDFAEVDRIEVAKGPFDVRHFGSLGGLVDVVTRRPEPGWHGSATLGLGDGSYWNPAVVASYGSRTWSALGGASYRRGDPFEDGRGAPMTAVANYSAAGRARPAFEVASGWARLAATPRGVGTMQAAWTRQQADEVLYPTLQMDAVYDDTDRASVSVDRSGGGAVQALQARATYARVRHWMTDANRVTAAGMARGYSMGTDARTTAGGARVDVTMGGVTAGAEWQHRSWDTRTLLAMRKYAAQASIPNATIESLGAFVDWRRPIADRVTVEAGGRLDRVESAADPTLANTALYSAYHDRVGTSRVDLLPAGRARAVWQAGPFQLGAGVGHVARVAEGNERYFALQRAGSDWVGNPALSPTRHTGVEARAGWMRGGAAVEAQLFAGRIDGYVVVYDQPRLRVVPGVTNAWARTYANTDARIAGAEVNASAPLGRHVFLSGDLSHARGSHRAETSRGIAASPLAEMPALRARVRLRVDDGRWFGVVEQVVTGDQRRIDASLGETPTPGAAATHVSFGARWRRVTVAAGVTNLFDRFYVDALSYLRDPFRSGARLPEPGRQWFATLGWRP